MLEINIGKPVHLNLNPRDAFLITCVAEYGDADGSDEFKMALFPNTPEYLPYLEEAIDFCERMKTSFPPRQSGVGTFQGMKEGGDRWLGFVPDKGRQTEIPEIYKELTECNPYEGWPQDPLTDYTQDAYFDSYKVHYFDADGIERIVDVRKVS